MFKKLSSGFLVLFGYLLSPLCWWIDLIFNLPIAYFLGKIGSIFSSELLLPCSILGYWLSNLVGILLMQFGAVEFFQDKSKERRFQKKFTNWFSFLDSLYSCHLGVAPIKHSRYCFSAFGH